MFTEVAENNISRVIVDLTDNGGGNDQVAWEFISYLGVESFETVTYEQRLGFITSKSNSGVWETDERTPIFDGEVIILTSAKTFSSAMLFALYIKDNSLGKIVGETPGNSANGYGDIAVFRLENSGLYLSVSTKKFSRVDTEAGDYIIPDIECDSEDTFRVSIGNK